MATDYDAPRNRDEDNEDSIEELKAARRPTAKAAIIDEDETDLAESLELPGADLSNEELAITVLPPQANEFTCAVCHLVYHRSQLAAAEGGRFYCSDCAA
jgi:hypothetical protein